MFCSELRRRLSGLARHFSSLGVLVVLLAVLDQMKSLTAGYLRIHPGHFRNIDRKMAGFHIIRRAFPGRVLAAPEFQKAVFAAYIEFLAIHFKFSFGGKHTGFYVTK